MSDPTAENGIYDTFTFMCRRRGCIVNVVGGIEQPHDCTASEDDRIAQVLVDLIADHPMWDGIDYTAEREGRIADFVHEATDAITNTLRLPPGKGGEFR